MWTIHEIKLSNLSYSQSYPQFPQLKNKIEDEIKHKKIGNIKPNRRHNCNTNEILL